MANFYLRLNVTESNTNIAKNTSVVTVGVTVVAQNEYSAYSYYTTSVSVSCGGQSGSFSVKSYNIPANGSVYLGSYAFTIIHSEDGSKTVEASASFFSGNSYIGNISAKANKTLSTIPRATTPTLIYADDKKRMDTSLTIGLPAASSAFTHNVSYKFGSASGTIAGTVKTSTVWTIPKALALQIPNAPSGTGAIIVDTYNGSSKIGIKEVSFTAAVSDEMVPSFTSITAARVDNGVPGTFGVYVQGYSKVTLTINGAVGSNGSTIKAYSITGDGYTSIKQTDTFGVLKNAGVIAFTGTITDSRGKTVSKTVSITVYEYQPPTLTFTVERCTSNGTISQEGTYLLVKPIYSCSSVNGKNYIASKSFSCGSYTNTTCASGSSCIIGAGAIAINQQYDVIGKVTDAIGQTISITSHVGTSTVPFNIKANGKGIAFGKYAEKENTLDSAWMIKMNGRMLIDWIVPVGTVITNSSLAFDPSIYYPGTTWQRIKGRVIVGVDEGDSDFITANKTGGKKSVALTLAQIPAHNHMIATNRTSGSPLVDFWQWAIFTDFAGQDQSIVKRIGASSTTAGNGQVHDNLQPFITKYIWERIA